MRCRAQVFPAPGKLDKATNTLDLVGRNLLSVHRVSESPEVVSRSLPTLRLTDSPLDSQSQELLIQNSHSVEGQTKAQRGQLCGWSEKAPMTTRPLKAQARVGCNSAPKEPSTLALSPWPWPNTGSQSGTDNSRFCGGAG